MNNIPDRALLKNLGHWLGIITIGRNKPILATVRDHDTHWDRTFFSLSLCVQDLEIKSIVIEAFHMGSQELLYVIPFVAKILESCAKSKVKICCDRRADRSSSC